MGKYKVLDIFSFLPANVISLEQLERYGIWVSLNVDLYRDIKEKIEIS